MDSLNWANWEIGSISVGLFSSVVKSMVLVILQYSLFLTKIQWMYSYCKEILGARTIRKTIGCRCQVDESSGEATGMAFVRIELQFHSLFLMWCIYQMFLEMYAGNILHFILFWSLR